MRDTEWFWEGNVVAALASHLKAIGWEIRSTADTLSGEAGPDIQASRSGRMLIVEAKGYPLTVYARGPNKGRPKRTNPATQARHWFAHAILAALLRQADYASAEVSIVLPDFPVYLNLLKRTSPGLSKLGIGVFLVDQFGRAREFDSSQ